MTRAVRPRPSTRGSSRADNLAGPGQGAGQSVGPTGGVGGARDVISRVWEWHRRCNAFTAWREHMSDTAEDPLLGFEKSDAYPVALALFARVGTLACPGRERLKLERAALRIVTSVAEAVDAH